MHSLTLSLSCNECTIGFDFALKQRETGYVQFCYLSFFAIKNPNLKGSPNGQLEKKLSLSQLLLGLLSDSLLNAANSLLHE